MASARVLAVENGAERVRDPGREDGGGGDVVRAWAAFDNWLRDRRPEWNYAS